MVESPASPIKSIASKNPTTGGQGPKGSIGLALLLFGSVTPNQVHRIMLGNATLAPTMLTIASPPRLGASPGSARRWPIRNNSGRDAGATGGNGEPPPGVRVEALVPPLHTN